MKKRNPVAFDLKQINCLIKYPAPLYKRSVPSELKPSKKGKGSFKRKKN